MKEKNQEKKNEANCNITCEYLIKENGKKCNKKYKTKQGYERHVRSKHSTDDDNETNEDVKRKHFNKTIMESIIKKSCEKLKDDKCLTSEVRNLFENMEINLNQIDNIFNDMVPIVKNYEDKVDIYFETCFNWQCNHNYFTDLIGKRNNSLLQSEIANQVLHYLSSKEENDLQSTAKKEITEKEMYGLQYLAGYVFHTLYRKFKTKTAKVNHADFWCSILLSGRVFQDEEQLLVNAKDRGGLWKVNNDALNIFVIVEKMFREATNEFITEINLEKLVLKALENSLLQSYYANIQSNAEIFVDDEVASNLLEEIVKLYIKVRSHSYARDVKEKYKVKQRRTKARSLRTELKKKSKNKSDKST